MSTSNVTKPNTDNAYSAMEALGIDQDTVKHVLKKLLRVFDKNWEFIEAENYRVLVDAILDYKENKEVEVKKKRTVDSDVCEPPKKRVYVCHGEDEPSPISVVPPISFSSENINTKKERVKPTSCSNVDKRKGKLPSAFEKVTSERASSSLCSKLPVDESRFVLADRDPPALNNSSKPSSRGTTRTPSGNQDLVEGSSSGNNIGKSSHCVHVESTRKCDSMCYLKRNERRYDIVSSLSGSVTLCCISTLNQATSNAPDIEAVLKSVEEKFLRSYKIVGPPFSFKRLLKELCKGFFKMTPNSTERSSEVDCPVKLPAIKNLAITNEKKSDAETTPASEDGTKKKPKFYVDDITKGQENVKISLVDEHGSRKAPKFFYIPKNIIYQKAIVNIALARISDEDCCSSCAGDCLSSQVPCACARTTQGEFAYTHEGLLKEEFLRDCTLNRYVYCQDCPIERGKDETKPDKCKGHSVRRFIKECWSKCGCNMQCGNRVVQRGITRQLQVFWTSVGKGWGLRTLEDLPKGAFVCEYVGEVVTNTELYERNNQSRVNERHTYPVQLDADWGSESILDDDYALCLDATNYGNVARFVNHRCCDANMFEVPVEVETVDHHYYHLAFFTTREVKALEELSWDYGLDFDDDGHPIKAFQCRCGSPLCRDKTRKGSRNKARAASSGR